MAREMQVVAVVVDSFRGDVLVVRNEVESLPVLRPTYERLPNYRDGPQPEKFVGYGLLDGRGEVNSISDGALDPHHL